MSLDMVCWLFSILLAGYVVPQLIYFSAILRCISLLSQTLLSAILDMSILSSFTGLSVIFYSLLFLLVYTLYAILFSLLALSVYTLYSSSSFFSFLLSVFTIISMSIRYVVLFFYSHFSLQCLYAKFNHLWYLAI